MSNFTNGRRAPNVSQYLANLNVPAGNQDVNGADFKFADDGLDFLTNTEFFDFDNFNVTNDFAPAAPQQQQELAQKPAMNMNNQQFQFGEFQAFTSPTGNTSPPNGLQNAYPAPQQQQMAYPAPANIGDKRKASAVDMDMSTPADLEDDSRHAAEEDKRRRNTAASARFRVKKKQREAALEKSAKEMTDKVSAMESRIQQLEMENKWLKGLITEKGDAKTLSMLSGATGAIAESQASEKEGEERSTDNRTDGVGTEA